MSCSLCQAGTYSSGYGLTMSMGCSLCQAGAYSSIVGTSSSMSCALCQAGAYSSMVGSSSSMTCTLCQAGTFQSNPGQSTCINCTAGTYGISAGASLCTTCTVGSYQSSTGQLALIPSTGPMAVTGSAATGYPLLTPSAGLYCTNFYSGSSGFTIASGTGSCVNDYQYACYPSVNAPCPFYDLYSPQFSWNAQNIPATSPCYCTAPFTPTSTSSTWTCTSGCVTTAACTNRANVLAFATPVTLPTTASGCPIAQCVSGALLSGTSCLLGQCNYCPAGTYTNTSAASACLVCTSGSYAPQNASACVLCTAGTYASMGGLSSCAACAPGFYTLGSFASTACQGCTAGKYANASGSSGCVACSAGTYASANGSSACLLCSAGQYSSNGLTQCQSCTACDPSLATTNHACGLGSVSNTVFCTCNAGYYGTGLPQGCSPCPLYTTSLNGSSSVLSCMCLPGYVCRYISSCFMHT